MIKERIQIIKNYQKEKQNFVFIVMPFNTDFDYQNWFEAVALAEKFGYISFYNGKDSDTYRCRDTYQFHDSYYKEMILDNTKIVMNMSLKKMELLGGLTSHLAVLLRTTKGVKIRCIWSYL